MKWNRFTIKTKTDAEDMIICTLAEIGVEGAEIQDHQPLTEEDKAQMFVDIMPEGPEDDGVAYLNFYLEEDADKDVILRDVRNALEELRTFMDIGEGTIEESQTEDKDWINNWKEFFHHIMFLLIQLQANCFIPLSGKSYMEQIIPARSIQVIMKRIAVPNMLIHLLKIVSYIRNSIQMTRDLPLPTSSLA